MVNVKEMLGKGYIQSRSIIEVLGKPREHVEQSLKNYIEQLKKNANYHILTTEFSSAEEVDKDQGLWGLFVEVEMLAKDLNSLLMFCFDYMPSSVEILQPESLQLNQNGISNILNDLQAKLHAIDMQTKKLNNENSLLKLNVKSLLTNFITVLLFNAEKSSDNLAKIIGTNKEELETFLELLVKEQKIIKRGEAYTLSKNVKREE